MNEKPLETIADKAERGSDEEDDGEREMSERETATPTESFSEIGSDSEIIELELRNFKNRFEI